jgi:UDP-glucuronate decarboxylase
MLREQRLLFVLVGIAIATLFFSFLPPHDHHPVIQSEAPSSTTRRVLYVEQGSGHYHPALALGLGLGHVNVGGRVPLGLKRKTLRVLVTGGAGFVGSHLVDRLIERGDSVIVVDNLFTGRKENLVHHFGNPRFELIRHDVVEPILLEVDQIYHLACPASPVHYKYNPVKTIISFPFHLFISFYIHHISYSISCVSVWFMRKFRYHSILHDISFWAC